MTTKYRGAMMSHLPTPADLEALLNYKANVFRYQMTDPAVENLQCDSYKTWVRMHLDHVESLLPILKAHGAKVVIDLHTPPAGIDRSGKYPVARMFTTRPWGLDCFKEVWAEIAARFKGVPEVLAFDLLNEPQCPTPGTAAQLTQLYKETIKIVRLIEPETPVIVSTPYGDPERVDQMIRYTNRNVWYSIHVYTMQPLTHQGIPPFPAGKIYPNENVNQKRIVKALSKMRAFQKKINCEVFIGEFGFSVFGDDESRRKWFRDVTNLLEKYGWQWCYHSFREAPVWNIENHPSVFKVITDLWNKNS